MMEGIITDVMGLGAVAQAFVAFVFILLVFGAISKAFRADIHEKSRRYRKYITNLFVASKIRAMAIKENLNLESEQVEFLKFCKTEGLRTRSDLDDVIEANTAEKIESDALPKTK